VYHMIRSINDTEVKLAQKKERQFDTFEEKARKLSEVKNNLETIIYAIRDMLDN